VLLALITVIASTMGTLVLRWTTHWSRIKAVQIAAAIGRPDTAKGEMPIAYVQLKPDAGTTVEELLALCRALVQERAAVPVEILIVPQIPVTAVGKINKPVLRAETMVRVAREQAAAVVGERGTLYAELDESGVLKSIAERYRSAVHGVEPHPAVDMDCRPCEQLLGTAAE